jgi:hypothetical protein
MPTVTIDLVSPTAEVPSVPPVAADYAEELPVKFSGSSLSWVSALPFLPWTPEAVAANAAPSFQTVPLFALEALMLPLISRADGLTDETLESQILTVKFIRQLLKALKKGGLPTHPMATAAEFVQQATVVVATLENDRVVTLMPTDLWDVIPRAANHFAGDARWFETVFWSWVAQVPSGWAACSVLFFLVGARSVRDRWRVGRRQQVLVSIIGAAYDARPGTVPLPEALKGNQVFAWFSQLLWPRSLMRVYGDVTVATAVDELLRALRYQTASPADRSLVLMEVPDRILAVCPNLQKIAGLDCSRDAAALAFPIMQPLLTALELPTDAQLEHFRLVDDRLSAEPDGLIRLIDGMGQDSKDVRPKVRVLLKELAETSRLDASKKGSAELVELHDASSLSEREAGSTRFPKRCSKASLHALRRSIAAQALVNQLQEELAKETPDRSRILYLMLSSRLSGFVRYALGVFTALGVFDVEAKLEMYTCNGFKPEFLQPVAICLGHYVTVSLHQRYPLLKSFAFSTKMVRVLFGESWDKEDWEQRLITDIDQWRMGLGDELDLDFRRDRSLWYTDESVLGDLVEPFTRLMEICGYPQNNTEDNSPLAVFEKAIDGFKFARHNPATSVSVRMKACRSVHEAIRDACQAFQSYLGSDSAVAEFPSLWLPADSSCSVRLDGAIASTDRFVVDFAANIPEIARKMLLGPSEPEDRRASTKRTPEARSELEEELTEAPPRKLQKTPVLPGNSSLPSLYPTEVPMIE